MHITLEFSEFSLQDAWRCSADSLVIREHGPEGNVIGQFCGNGLPPPIISSVGLWMKFYSDWRDEKMGFRLRYDIRGKIYGS